MQKNERRATVKVNPAPAAYPNSTAAAAIRSRRETARRLPPLACGCADPWPCHCAGTQQSDNSADAYRDAVDHLAQHGILAAPLKPELRVLMRRGGADRRAALTIFRRWSA